MIKFLIKSTNEVRIETKPDVDEFHNEIERACQEQECVLSNWNESLKVRKSKGEIIEEWYIVKYTLVFNDPKDPEKALKDIQFNMYDNFVDVNEGE